MKPVLASPTLAVVILSTSLTSAPSAVLPSIAPPSSQQQQGLPAPNNVLFIVLDDLGTDKLSLYGETPGPYNVAPFVCDPPLVNQFGQPQPYEYPLTPNLGLLAAGMFPGVAGGGILFTRAYANPVCSPTRACFQTGRYAFRTSIGTAISVANPGRVHESEVFVPELLKNGFAFDPPQSPAPIWLPYRCGAFGKWHLTTIGDIVHPILNGYDFFQGAMGNSVRHYNWARVTYTSELFNGGSEAECDYFNVLQPQVPFGYCNFGGNILPGSHSESEWDASVTGADAKAWINDQDPTKSFFAYVAINPPHSDFQVPPDSLLTSQTKMDLQNVMNCGGPHFAGDTAGTNDSVSKKVIYRATLEAVDMVIGNLLSGINPEKLANTTIIVMGDNGTPMDVVDEARHNPDQAKGTTYQLGTRVPLIVAGPLVPNSGHVCDGLVGAVDLWRTIGDIAGADPGLADPQLPVDSVSFIDLIEDPDNATSQRDYAFCQIFSPNEPYEPTAHGPIEPGCTQGGDFCKVQPFVTHQRSLTNGVYELIRTQVVPGIDGFPQGSPDTAPVYTEEFYNISNEKPSANLIHRPAWQQIISVFRAKMTDLSGY